MQKQLELSNLSKAIPLDSEQTTEEEIKSRIKLAIQEAELCKQRAELLLMQNINQNEPDPTSGEQLGPEQLKFIEHQQLRAN